MYRDIGKLVFYRIPENSILGQLAGLIREFEEMKGSAGFEGASESLTDRIYGQIHRLLSLATRFGFDKNLWRDYIAYILAMHENPFTLVSEKMGGGNGTANVLALNDFLILKRISEYDFSDIEKALGISCFSQITNYKAVMKSEQIVNQSVSSHVRELSEKIDGAGSDDELYEIITGFYREHGVGMFGLNKAFRLAEGGGGVILPISNTSDMVLDDLIGYEIQKEKLIANTESFVEGRPANNVLLYGDAGTGKSSSIKAILNTYYPRGLRMIEVYKHQFKELSRIVEQVKNRNYRFVIYMDDLSFEDFEIEYKYLKAVIEGGLETKPENVLIYATSNRRHLIKETWSDRNDMDDELHRSDTMQEKLSLAARFGVKIGYYKPSRQEFYDIVTGLAKKYPQISLTEEELLAEANKWELRHGGVSGRTARQFIDYLLGSY